MSTRSTLAALTAGAGVLAWGWSLGATSSTSSVTPSQPQTTQTQTTQTQSGQTQTSQGSSLKDGTWTGQTVTHRYGSVTVTVVVTNGAIASLSEDVVSDGDHHSERINDEAVPVLRQEVLAANSAQVNTVSGGTYTSEAYLQSLQSALDEARA
ncbi:FMN-binding protein [Aestuariimicrobium soli]|uniref:FMN-binding protein n=1 Tax=Aestuariimicrobium soli TaxID=2035834 RepID=UPI003EBF89A5